MKTTGPALIPGSVLFRAPGSRIEHFTRNIDVYTTLCGISAKNGARFRASERGQDAKLRPICARCRNIADA